jgi:MinD-like ATPase involved in chromosome partitioning or flagellar assembly
MQPKKSASKIDRNIVPMTQTGDIRNQLDEFYRSGFLNIISSLPKTSIKKRGKGISKTLRQCSDFFDLARIAADNGEKYDLLIESAEKCKRLFENGYYIKEVADFLCVAVQQKARSHLGNILSIRAFDSLIAGVRSSNLKIVQQCIAAFAFVLDKLTGDQRAELLKEIAHYESSEDSDRDVVTLAASTRRYLMKLDSIDEAFEHISTVFEPGKVISVHSSKGGVGKSTIAIAVAIQIAQDERSKVCLVDADDEGPCLEFYLPVDVNTKRNQYRFVDWFTSPNAYHWFPKEMIMPLIPGKESWRKRLFVLPGSIIATEIEKLDAAQRDNRPDPRRFGINRQKLIALATHLLQADGDDRFTHVIFDTAPGMAHLSYDVFLSTIQMNGTIIVVTRPRPSDIVALATEQAYLADTRLNARLSLAVVFVSKNAERALTNPERVVSAIMKTPITAAFMGRYPDEMPPKKIRDFFVASWDILKNRCSYLEFVGSLTHAADLSFDDKMNKTIAEEISESAACRNTAKEILQLS